MLLTLQGIIHQDKGRGKTLGYPTANISAPADAPEGIFVGFTSFEGKRLPSLIFIGPAITFGETEKKAEVFLLDFEGDLYGKEITVEVMKKLRDNQKFATAEELVEQMKRDEEEAKVYFRSL